MSILDFFNDIEFKGDKANTLLKWVVAIAIAGITFSFILGQVKSQYLNKLNNIEALAKKGIEKTEQLELEMKVGFAEQNAKIEKVYDDALKSFDDYKEFNNKQLKLIIDYGQENKELLKKMLDVNNKEKEIDIKNKINQSKNDVHNQSSKIDSEINTVGYRNIKPNIIVITQLGTGLKTYHITNAPSNYLDTLNLSKYKIIEKKESLKYDGLYDFTYTEKKL